MVLTLEPGLGFGFELFNHQKGIRGKYAEEYPTDLDMLIAGLPGTIGTHRYIQLRCNMLVCKVYKVSGPCGHFVHGTYSSPVGQH